VWRLVDRESGKVKAIYTAVEGDSMAVVDDLIEDGEVDLEGEDEKKKLEANEPESENSESNEESQQQDSKNSKEPASTCKIETTEAGFKLSIRDFNIWLSKPSGSEIQISTNGTASNPYDATRTYPSPTSHFAVIWQYTPAQEHFLNLIESSPKEQLQPKLKSIQYFKPGDRVRVDRPRLFDLERGCEIETDDELFRNPYKVKDIGWRNDEEYCFIFNGRGHQYIRILGVNLKGVVRSIVEEKSETFIDYSSKWKMRFMRESNEVLWMSGRDGWNHLYLFDVEKGRLKNRVTEGEWVVRSVASVDEERRRIWRRGFGMVKGQDPYYAHLASVNFDGSGFTILTEGDGTHTWKWSPTRRFFIDMWSRVDYPPETVLREAETGKLIMGLEKCELNALLDAGWDAPERFEAPGRDGETLIYGIIIRPSVFDPSKKYPILEDIYAGPQDFHTPKAFSSSVHQRKWADQGYIVVLLDGMGTNWRSKAFHGICYKNLKDAGLPDRIAWIKAAAKTRPWMDISRVGIRGTSAGGQSAVAALLFHGSFYKAGIADSGCHDNRMDKIWWNEQWMGYPVDKSYEESSNVVHAGKLKGALMLTVGELDGNVDPSSTMQLVHALNEAGKDYELLFITGGGHGAGSSPYGMRRQGDFFRRHLQGGELVQHNAS
jgi:dienelactone hydrolase